LKVNAKVLFGSQGGNNVVVPIVNMTKYYENLEKQQF
jgi:hypothetical protein